MRIGWRLRAASCWHCRLCSLLGFDLQDWAKEGVLADLNELAREERWDQVIAPALQRFAKYDGK